MLKWSHNRDGRLTSSVETVGKKRSNWFNNFYPLIEHQILKSEWLMMGSFHVKILPKNG